MSVRPYYTMGMIAALFLSTSCLAATLTKPSTRPRSGSFASHASAASTRQKTSRASTKKPATSGTSISKTSQASTRASVTLQNFAFSVGTLTVKQGTTVTWTNNDSAPHTVTGEKGGPGSPSLSQGQSYAYTFDTVGTFPYHCVFHRSMTGVVVVTK